MVKLLSDKEKKEKQKRLKNIRFGKVHLSNLSEKEKDDILIELGFADKSGNLLGS